MVNAIWSLTLLHTINFVVAHVNHENRGAASWVMTSVTGCAPTLEACVAAGREHKVRGGTREIPHYLQAL